MGEPVEQLIDRHWRGFAESRSLRFQQPEHRGWREVDQMQDEDVGRLRLDVVGPQHIGRKVADVLGDDDLGIRMDPAARTWRS